MNIISKSRKSELFKYISFQRDDHDDDADYDDDTPRQDEIKDMKKEAEIEIIEIDSRL